MESVQESVEKISANESGTSDNAVDQQATQEINVLDVPVTNENVALNILVTFVNLAQKRGAFNLKESAKIWECVERFQRAGSK
jgi:hypothetical protein